MSILAIDFGGTRIRAAHFSETLDMLARQETRSLVNQPAEQVIQRLIDLARQVMSGTAPRVIGIAVPGPMDAEKGIIFHARTLPGWQNIPLSRIVSEAFGETPVCMQNDANLAALAEYHQGAAQGANPVIYLTISTGIGGGAVIDGKLFTGWRGLAIEPGHLQIPLPDGTICRLEELASGTALGLTAQRLVNRTAVPSVLRDAQEIDGQAVGEAALTGDALALQVVQEAGRWLGIGLVNVLHLFNPQVIVVGGSVAQLGELILAPARQVISERILDARFDDPGLIRLARLGDDVCLVGAALYAKNS